MQKWINIMGGLLALQLLLALALNLSGEDYGAFQPKQKLLAFDAGAVNALRIEEGQHKLLLQKQDGRWLLPDNGGFPAEQPNVQRLLDKLAGLQQGWPVATTASALRRFKVADDAYQTRISLLADERELARLYVGTSPGLRKVHARPATADAVFAVDFNSWEASAKADDWIDQTILQLDQASLQRLELPGVALHRQDGGFQVTDLAAQEQTDPEAVNGLLDKLSGLRIQSLLGSEANPAYRQNQPALEIKLTRNTGEPLTYRFSKPEGESYYVLKRSDLDFYFKLPEFSVKPLLETDRAKLVSHHAESSPAPTSGGQENARSMPAATPVESISPVDSTTPVESTIPAK